MAPFLYFRFRDGVVCDVDLEDYHWGLSEGGRLAQTFVRFVRRGLNMAKKKSKTTAFDSAQYLDIGEAVSAYMEEALETEDPVFIAQALGTVARARGMSEIAKQAGLSRESLYKALSSEGNPESGTVLRVMHALGLKFSITPTRAH
jgi:probable addiction module antidote protein